MTEPSRGASVPEADQHSVFAEEVRAFLVSVRGGAPFLSAADGRLLVGWLDQGVPVAAILSAIERTAQRRAGRRLRTRMSLGACKGEVKKLAGLATTSPRHPSDGASTVPRASSTGLQREVDRISALAVPPQAAPPRDALVLQLRALAQSSASPDEMANVASAAVRQFHEALWDATASLHAELAADARQRLAPLEAVVSAKVFADLLDEHTRQAVRALVPGVAVEPIWSALGFGAPQ